MCSFVDLNARHIAPRSRLTKPRGSHTTSANQWHFTAMDSVENPSRSGKDGGGQHSKSTGSGAIKDYGLRQISRCPALAITSHYVDGRK